MTTRARVAPGGAEGRADHPRPGYRPIANSVCAVRTYIAPPDNAGVAMIGSSMALVAIARKSYFEATVNSVIIPRE